MPESTPPALVPPGGKLFLVQYVLQKSKYLYPGELLQFTDPLMYFPYESWAFSELVLRQNICKAWSIHEGPDTGNTIAGSFILPMSVFTTEEFGISLHQVLVTAWRSCLKRFRANHWTGAGHQGGNCLRVGKEHKSGIACTSASWISCGLNWPCCWGKGRWAPSVFKTPPRWSSRTKGILHCRLSITSW